MGKVFDSLDNFIQEHVKQLLKSSGMQNDDESLDALAGAWLEKKQAFEDGVSTQGMEEIDFFSKEDDQGALVMTYSGSLLNIGPLVDGFRRCEYTSIGLRKDVPQSALEESSELEADFETDAVASFKKGPVRKTSPILKIARFKKKMDPELEESKLSEVTQILADDFVEVNKTVIR
jgi:hypothetical protein